MEGIIYTPSDSLRESSLIQFEFSRSDSMIHIVPINSSSAERIGPGEYPDTRNLEPDSSKSLSLHYSIFLNLSNSIQDSIDPDHRMNLFSYEIRDGEIMFQVNRGTKLTAVALFGLAALIGTSSIVSFIIRRRSLQKTARSRELQRRQIEASEAERLRIAREIHDGPLQDLHAVRARASAAHAIGGDGAALEVAEEVSTVARELRGIAEGLRPPALGRLGLPAVLAAHGSRMTEREGVFVRVDADEDAPPLSDEAEASLFRIVQEALNNAVHHGKAQRLEVQYAVEPSSSEPTEVRIEVRDDGIGLADGLDPEELVLSGHFGLAGMRERADLLGGTFHLRPNVSTDPSRPGATVTVRVPWDRVRRLTTSPT